MKESSCAWQRSRQIRNVLFSSCIRRQNVFLRGEVRIRANKLVEGARGKFNNCEEKKGKQFYFWYKNHLNYLLKINEKYLFKRETGIFKQASSFYIGKKQKICSWRSLVKTVLIQWYLILRKQYYRILQAC